MPLDTNIEMCKVVSDYTKLDFERVQELDCDLFMLYYKQSIVSTLCRTADGQEILKTSARLQAKAPDIKGLKRITERRNVDG